jgi:hypothetical protein
MARQTNVATAMIALGKALLWLLMIPVGLCFKAVVVQDLWGWFVVPLGVPAVGMVHALGLCLVGWIFSCGLDNIKEKQSQATWHRWAMLQVVVLIVWGYGALFNWIGV